MILHGEVSAEVADAQEQDELHDVDLDSFFDEAPPSEPQEEAAGAAKPEEAEEAKPDETKPDVEAARLEKVIAETSLEISRLKAKAKSLKKMLDGYTEEYDSIRLRLADAEDGGEVAAGAAGSNGQAAGELPPADQPVPAEAASDVPVVDLSANAEAWRGVTLEALGIAAGIRKSLEENGGITTLGGLADWTKDGKKLTEVRGIGDGKAEKIADACERFWAKNAVPQ